MKAFGRHRKKKPTDFDDTPPDAGLDQSEADPFDVPKTASLRPELDDDGPFFAEASSGNETSPETAGDAGPAAFPGDDVRRIEDFFSENGPLRRMSALSGRIYEMRPQQLEMALAIQKHLEQGHNLAVEAPTGVGKTFAYLVPAILAAAQADKPVVITTHTITLQEQIVGKDLPMLRQLFAKTLKFALAKGRSNYLCRRRLGLLGNHTAEMLPGLDLASDLERIQEWSETTRSGDRAELPFEPAKAIWESVCCEPWNCMKGKCPCFEECFLFQARRRLGDADVIVANHALYFADLRMRLEAARLAEAQHQEAGEDPPESLLPPHAAVIIDEGHTLEETAAEHLGLRLNSTALLRTLGRLYQADKGKGLLFDCEDARLAVISAADKATHYFDRIRHWIEEHRQNPIRYAQPNYFPDLIGPALESVERELKKVCQELESDPTQQEFVQELTAHQQALFDYRHSLHLFLEMELPECVYWVEMNGGSIPSVSFNAVPIDLAPLLQEHLFGAPKTTTVITSATLAVRGRMDFFLGRIGGLSCDSLVLSSPFDFQRQVTLYLNRRLPDPSEKEFLEAACTETMQFLDQTEGKAFVLFTSYKMMKEAAKLLEDYFDSRRYRLMIQGEGLSRSKMLEEFKKDVHSVIFGTSSFWTGVDVPGEALSNVIIVKLPFAVPDHPLVVARQELVERQGGNFFRDCSLPEAVLKFRQGFGRLIRSQSDTGIVVVLDRRVLTKTYGQAFLESLPPCRVEQF